jgi:transposase
MVRPYSRDLRERVIASVASGRTCRETAALFEVSVASVVKWSQRWRTTGSVVAKPMGGRKLVLLSEREWLLSRLAARPDVTLRGLQAELAERGIVVSHNAIWKLFAVEGISFKKKPTRLRAGSPGRGAPAGAVEEVPGQA